MSALQVLQAHVLAGRSSSHDARRMWRRILWPLLAAACVLVVWSSTAPLAGAVVAAAQVKVEYRRKTVQHLEGGIVREILVRDGQAVRAGQALMVIADARQEAELSLLQAQWRAARWRVARAEAEARLAPGFDAPSTAPPDAADADPLGHEKAVFAMHRRALDEQGQLLQVQIRQAGAQAVSLQQQLDATAASNALSQEELALNEHLAQQGYVSRSRLITLQRTATDYQSRLGEVGSDLALARQRAAELQARQAQLRLSYQSQATDEAREAAQRLGEIEQRLRTPRDQVERQTVRAPVDGEVMSLHVTTAGAVIAPREALLDIVPQHEKLVVEAHIEPRDIEHVRVGGAAEVRLLGGQADRGPMLPATVSFVSADRVVAADAGKAWFDVTVEVDAQALQQQAPGQRLLVGMPAELYVTTRARTLFEYLAKPLRSFFGRALRESD